MWLPPRSSPQDTVSLGQEGQGKSQVKGAGSERMVDSSPASGGGLPCTEETPVPGNLDGAYGPARTIPVAPGSSQDTNPGRTSQVRPRGHGRAEQAKVLSPQAPRSEAVSGKRPKRVRVAASRRTQQLGAAKVPTKFPAPDKAQAHSLTMESVDGDDVPVDPANISMPPGGDQALQPLRPGQRQDLFFYVGGANGANLVSAYCLSQGWQRLQDPHRQDYQLKWCEAKSRQAYSSFREGKQLLYQIPNNKHLTTKIGLLNSLREYGRIMSRVNRLSIRPRRILKMEDFFPETFRLDVKEEREAFFTSFDEPQIWICKPTGSNQGRGIFLLQHLEDVASLLVDINDLEGKSSYRKLSFRAPQPRIVQRYIQNPLLVDGRKFDVRSYLLIACAAPFVVLFSHGYVRLTLSPYDPLSKDLTSHLTNQSMQKKHPLYQLRKEETVWSMERLNSYINDNFCKDKELSWDWVLTAFTGLTHRGAGSLQRRMQQIMTHCFLATKSKLDGKLGYFDLIGCDFLIDEDFKVWLLEMNANPALHTHCQVLRDLIPSLVYETLDLALETFHKSLRRQTLLPLERQRRFVLLYLGSSTPGLGPGPPLAPLRSRRRPPPPAPTCGSDPDGTRPPGGSPPGPPTPASGLQRSDPSPISGPPPQGPATPRDPGVPESPPTRGARATARPSAGPAAARDAPSPAREPSPPSRTLGESRWHPASKGL
ncbi:inactive polyglycylase TTLL10 isoform X3 [Tachyglossus aculeatus]|uniref:inactive polyglycylase TTLL10 isoform X3 n=1 Tax=Tachyglossus aculeatus TaxID=9261 RepID=UPI0018F4F35E|nr:inactive polyglycylase TTLL10 isoform X3 [Tachyglossus aculeatus]